VYTPVSRQHTAEIVSHLHDLYREAATSGEREIAAQAARQAFSRGLLTNLRHSDTMPTPHLMLKLSRHFMVTTGGAYETFGYNLDGMREYDFLLNGHRTRIIESYPFQRDLPVDLPYLLGKDHIFGRSSFLSEMVPDWQSGLPIRAINGRDWLRHGTIYIQVGTQDSLASRIPPGAFASVAPIAAEEHLHPDPRSIYLLQFGSGYRCCCCSISNGKLTLITQESNYAGPYDFLYPQQVRIVGRVRMFALRLPLTPKNLYSPYRPDNGAPLILPSEQRSLHELFAAKGKRFSIAEKSQTVARGILEAALHTNISWRTVRRYQHKTDTVPRTSTLLGLTLLHAARFTDVLKSLDFWRDESNYYSLQTLLGATKLSDLPLVFPNALRPSPRHRWTSIREEWGEWSPLLSMVMPRLRDVEDKMLRVYQSDLFAGLDPLIPPGSVALLEELDRLPDTREDSVKDEWERPIYAVRHGPDILCGYLENDGTHIALVPHPLSISRRKTFLRHQVSVLGRFAFVAVPV
jgi:hypothetical protein